jgi:serine/threonine-protein kinase
MVESQTAERLIGGRYHLGRVLGEGGMASVYDAFDARLERQVAVKILHSDTEALPGMRTRFAQEARLAARLIHPNIVAVLDYGEDQTSCFLVMERLPGTTLRDEISRGPLPMGRVVLVVTETLAALQAAHQFGVLHRDIKPSNILLQEDGHAKITDFGIAKTFDARAIVDGIPDDMTQAGVVLGTPAYLAPERRSGRPATVQSDLYAVGAVMVEAVTGARVESGWLSSDAVPPPWRDVTARAIADGPDARFASAAAMARALTDLQQGRPTPLPPTETKPASTQSFTVTPPSAQARTDALPAGQVPRDPRRAPRRLRRRVLAGFVVLLALAGGLAIAYGLAHQASGHTAARHASTAAHASHPAAPAPSLPVDTVGAALTAEAASLNDGGMPGDQALAGALDETAAQPPGPARVAAAQQAMGLAQVLQFGGGITTDQYQAATATLESAGATPPATGTAPQETPSQQAPPPQTPPAPPSDHGHGHGGGDGQGDSQS